MYILMSQNDHPAHCHSHLTPHAQVISYPSLMITLSSPSLWSRHSHTRLSRFQLSLHVKGWLHLSACEPGFSLTSWAPLLVLARGWEMAELSCVWRRIYCLVLLKFTICYWKLLLCRNFLLGLQHLASHCLLACISTIGEMVVSIF